MHIAMASGADGDQITLGVITVLTAPGEMMHFELRPPSAVLAPPAVTPQDLLL